ncbi:MAG: hypothetical protein FD166_2409 [Bacteroidetes bacterium]|nr:MAG: hypothetical protein FD166_2409 [Bacteroidota bacterium]
MQSTLINLGIIISYILLFVSILTALVFPLMQTISNFKAAKGGLIGVGVVLVIFIVSYAVSPADTGVFYDRFGISPTLSKLIGGGLVATYLFFIAAAISIIYASMTKFFR